MKKIITVAVFGVMLAFGAQAKEVTIEATGVADDYDSAVLNALDNAVRQSSRVYVDKSSPDFQMELSSKDKITARKDSTFKKKEINIEKESKTTGKVKSVDTYYSGIVYGYKVISHEEKDNRHYVTISAQVQQKEDYKSPGLGKKAEYSLAVFPFSYEKSYSCYKTDSADGNGVSIRINQAIVNDLVASEKFTVVDRTHGEEYNVEADLIRAGYTDANARDKLRNIASADYMLVGEIGEFNVSSTKKSIPEIGEEYTRSRAKLQLNYRIVEMATMEIIASDSVSASLRRDGNLGSCNNVLKKLSDKAAEDMTEQIIAKLFPDSVKEKKPAKKKKKAPKIVCDDDEQDDDDCINAEIAAEKKAKKPQKREIVKLPFDD